MGFVDRPGPSRRYMDRREYHIRDTFALAPYFVADLPQGGTFQYLPDTGRDTPGQIQRRDWNPEGGRSQRCYGH